MNNAIIINQLTKTVNDKLTKNKVKQDFAHFGKDELFLDLILELKLRNYSPKTSKSYVYHNYNFIKWCKKLPTQIKKSDISDYFKYLILDKKVNSANFNIIKNSLKFYYEQIRNKKFKIKRSVQNNEKKLHSFYHLMKSLN